MMLQKLILQLEISFHWYALQRKRRNLFSLYDRGVPLSSEKMIRISNAMTRHGMRLVDLDRRYERLLLD